jgi:hypothetical protein
MTLYHLRNLVIGDFSNLDFAFNALKHSYLKDPVEFEMRWAHLSYLMQFYEIRLQFTDCRSKIFKMMWMMIGHRIAKIFNLYE